MLILVFQKQKYVKVINYGILQPYANNFMFLAAIAN